MPELVIGGIALAPVIVAIIELCKKWFGLPSEWAPLLNAVLSAVAYIAIAYFGVADMDLAAIVVNVLVIFLSAAGFYITSKSIVRAAKGG